MPITILNATETHPFLDENGKEVEGASFTIKAKLSHDAMRDYGDAVIKLRFDPETNQPQRGDINLREAEEALIRHGLVKWEGLLDENGTDWPTDKWRELPGDLVSQILRELQKKAVRSVPNPNSEGPSKKSSKVAR